MFQGDLVRLAAGFLGHRPWLFLDTGYETENMLFCHSGTTPETLSKVRIYPTDHAFGRYARKWLDRQVC